MYTPRVSEILGMIRQKRAITIPPEASVFEALELLNEMDVGSLLVVEGDEFFGIFTERDYARKGELKGKRAIETQVQEVMTLAAKVFHVGLDSTIDECDALVELHRVRHLPVLEKGKVVGVLSMRDINRGLKLRQTLVERGETSYRESPT